MTLGDFWILHRNTRVFQHIYKKVTCIKQTYVFHIAALHPKFITRNKPRKSIFMWIQHFNLSNNSDVKPKKKKGSVSLCLTISIWRISTSSLGSPRLKIWHNANTAFKLTQKILWGNLSISWSHSLRQLYTGANVTSWQWVLGHRLTSWLIDFKILPNHSFSKNPL